MKQRTVTVLVVLCCLNASKNCHCCGGLSFCTPANTPINTLYKHSRVPLTARRIKGWPRYRPIFLFGYQAIGRPVNRPKTGGY